MPYDYWERQDPAEPLFKELLWSRPENRLHAGKLLIVGGNAHGFAAPARAYQEAGRAGIGVCRVLLPDVLRRTIGRTFEAGEYAPSTPSGSFAQTALAELLDSALWSDSVLLAGDFGRNSETAILLEAFAAKYGGQLTLSGDALDYFLKQPSILERPATLLAGTVAQLQKVLSLAHATQALTSNLDLVHMIEVLHQAGAHMAPHLLVEHDRTYIVAADGHISSTAFSVYTKPDLVVASTHATVWWLQNPTASFAALTTALVPGQ